jgi:hypothetical protein
MIGFFRAGKQGWARQNPSSKTASLAEKQHRKFVFQADIGVIFAAFIVFWAKVFGRGRP